MSVLFICLCVQELNEDPERRLELIQELGRQVTEAEAANDDLKFTRKDNKFLLCFLRARKFDVERALQLFVNYHKYRVKYAHLLTDYNAKSVEHILNSEYFGVLDQPLNDGSRCLVFLPGRYDIHNIPVSSLLKAALLVMDKLIEDEETQVLCVLASCVCVCVCVISCLYILGVYSV